LVFTGGHLHIEEYAFQISKFHKIADSYGGEMFASVSGNSYVYEKATITENIEGTTITEEMTGSGVKNGTTISGTGVIKFHAYGETFTGTWTCTLVKK
jgi:hypothetical protein